MVDKTECPVVADWQEMKGEFREAVSKLDRMNATVGETNSHVIEIMEHVKHLEKLDVIATVLGRIANRLLYAVISAMIIFGGLLVIVVIKDTSARVAAQMPGGVSLEMHGTKSK